MIGAPRKVRSQRPVREPGDYFVMIGGQRLRGWIKATWDGREWTERHSLGFGRREIETYGPADIVAVMPGRA